jgi:hypothetical protein
LDTEFTAVCKRWVHLYKTTDKEAKSVFRAETVNRVCA